MCCILPDMIVTILYVHWTISGRPVTLYWLDQWVPDCIMKVNALSTEPRV